MSEAWFFLNSPAASAAYNMALDEALLRTAAGRGRPLLRVYSWRKPSVSIGYFQRFPAHLAGKYEIVRRPTGGGLVYHVDDTTYTIVIPPQHSMFKLRASEAYCALHKAVAVALGEEAALSESVTVPRPDQECFQNPVRGDVISAGRKLAGAAQRRSKWGMLHQGSIATAVPAERVREGFAAEFEAAFQTYEPSGEECAVAEWLADGKYATDKWNKRVM